MVGQKIGIFYVLEDLIRELAITQLFEAMLIQEIVTVKDYHNGKIYKVTATFEEFEPLLPNTEIPEYMFIFHRQPNGSLVRDEAKKISE